MKDVVVESRKFKNDVCIDHGLLTNRNTTGQSNMRDNITFFFFQKEAKAWSPVNFGNEVLYLRLPCQVVRVLL